jgi:hypothetical protein
MTSFIRMLAAAALFLCSAITPVAADDDIPAAAKAYSQGEVAVAGGDHALAAEMFELADSLAPSAVALRNATRERYAANQVASAGTLATELLHRYPNDKESRQIAEGILEKVTPILTLVDVKCSETCTLLLDGKAVFAKARDQYTFFTTAGSRKIEAKFSDGQEVTRQIIAIAAQQAHLEFRAPPKLVVTPKATVGAAAEPSGISRWWVLSGTVITLGLAGVAVDYGLKTIDTKNKIVAANNAGDLPTRNTLYNTGVDQQRLTNIFIGASAAVGVATLAAVFFTNWHGGSAEAEPPAVAIVPSTQGASVVYSGAF